MEDVMSTPPLVRPNPFNAAQDFDVTEEKILSDLIEEGKALAKAGKIEEAIVIFENLVNKNPNDAEILANYARAMRDGKQYEKAANLFDRSLKIVPNQASVIMSYITLLRDTRQYEKAFSLFDRALELEPDNIITLNSYAGILAKGGYYEKAFSLFDRSLELEPDNARTLTSYANLLANQGYYEKAFSLFDRSLELEPDNAITVRQYTNLLVNQGNYEKAFPLFDRALEPEPDNARTLAIYANILAKRGDYEKAFPLFDRSLELEPDNVITLNTYGNLLASQGYYEKAFSLFDRALEPEPDNARTLATYANILAKRGDYEKAFPLFDRALELKPDDVITLSTYANFLADQDNYEKTFSLFDRALELEPDNVIVLNAYANILKRLGHYKESLKIFKQILDLEPDNIIILTNCANILVEQQKIEEAIDLFNKAINLKPDDTILLTSYANALARNGQLDQAFILFERALSIDNTDTRTIKHFTDALLQAEAWERIVELKPNFSYARFKYSQKLESQRQYQKALDQLLTIDLSSQQNYHANVIRLSIGRLYYCLKQTDRALQFIEEAIQNSEDADQSRLHAARSLLASNPNSEEAIDLLRKIQETSPRYVEAMKTIALNADAETAYELFAGAEPSLGDTTMLYRGIYHKIGNEVAILKSIAQRILRKIKGEHPLVQEIVSDLDVLQQSVTQQRATEKATIATIPRESYQELIRIVSTTAHNIADEVNNSLAAIVSKTRRILRKLEPESVLQQSFEKLLTQLELTQGALNDLKAINEGIKIRRHRFPVSKLFEKWQPENWSNTPQIDRARIKLNIQNPDSEFDGDEEKIKSILNELVENALKQNPRHSDLCIWIKSLDLLNPRDISMPTIPGNRKYLLIQVTDNGKGIPEDKKEWIFQPLNTTSPEEKGSGLGLFIARKTLQKMGGQIRETGDPGWGARFQIYLPYLSSQDY